MRAHGSGPGVVAATGFRRLLAEPAHRVVLAVLPGRAGREGEGGGEGGGVVASVGGQEAERQRFFARMGSAPLTTRRIVSWEQLGRQLSAWRRCWLPVPRGPARVLPGPPADPTATGR